MPVPLPEQFFHPEAQSWRARVIANGGTFKASTLAAVSRFCFAIDAAGLRDRFYRLNLFCGDNLQACLVPLYRGESPNSTQYGNLTDTNINFVNADYRESGILSGITKTASAANSKYLSTGVRMDALPQVQTLHLAISIGTFASAGYVFGVTAGPAFLGFVSSAVSYSFSNPNNQGGINRPAGSGRYCSSRTSQTLCELMYNGGRYAVYTADVGVATAGTQTISIFAAASIATGCNRMNNYSFGNGMSLSQVVAYDAIIAAFESALDRR